MNPCSKLSALFWLMILFSDKPTHLLHDQEFNLYCCLLCIQYYNSAYLYIKSRKEFSDKKNSRKLISR